MASAARSLSPSVEVTNVPAKRAVRRERVVAESIPLERARPFLKWAGGKSKLVESIFKRFPPSYGRYFEPFLGGGAVFFALGPNKATVADVNAELITAYSSIRDDVEGVIDALSVHRAEEAHFYSVRSQSKDGMAMCGVAARMIFLNRTCFNGLYRVNRAGAFNVPFGRYDNPRIVDEDNLRAVSRALKNVDVLHANVFATVEKAKPGDLIYFDPPYDPVSKTASFVGYTNSGFGPTEQQKLALTFSALANRGVHVVLSNSDTPFIRELYKDFRIDTLHVRRAINSRADRRGTVQEVLVSST
ncbi:MAG: DNA adenine methylase [Clostridia bacterium]|nr:DNA adenine methylase [Deltaproteobacteria bacterium]